MKAEEYEALGPLTVGEPPTAVEARAYLDHRVSQEENRIQLTEILCRLLRSTLLCKQRFGSDSPFPLQAREGRLPLWLLGEGRQEEEIPFWHELPSAFPRLGCQGAAGRRCGTCGTGELLTQGGCGGCLEPFGLCVAPEPHPLP